MLSSFVDKKTNVWMLGKNAGEGKKGRKEDLLGPVVEAVGHMLPFASEPPWGEPR